MTIDEIKKQLEREGVYKTSHVENFDTELLYPVRTILNDEGSPIVVLDYPDFESRTSEESRAIAAENLKNFKTIVEELYKEREKAKQERWKKK